MRYKSKKKEPQPRDLKKDPYRLLITGHKGFIGSYVSEFILNDPIYQDFKIDCIDLQDGNDLGDFTRPHVRYDCVLHLAAFAALRESIEKPNHFWVNNVEKSKGIFKYCEVNNIRLLYASSAGAKDWWLNPYATTKRVNEAMAPYNSLGLRFFNVYREGKTSRPDMLYRMLEEGTATYLTRHYRDWIHVHDVARAIVRLMISNMVGTVDIGTGKATGVLELAKVFGQDHLPIKEETPGEPDTLVADTTKLEEVGWYPTYNVIESATEWLQIEKEMENDESSKLDASQQEGKEAETETAST